MPSSAAIPPRRSSWPRTCGCRSSSSPASSRRIERRQQVSSRFIVRRIGLGILTLWLVSLIVFAAVIALPGDAATAILGKEATPDRVAALRDQLHLNDSTVSQYLHWLGGIVKFDLGNSAATQQPVTQLLSDRVGNSAFLVFIASVIAIPLSIFIGVWMAMERDRAVDHVTSTVTLVLAALPEFVIGICLILI